MTKPDFIIIGAMKSATSTLHEQLAQQAGIFMTTPKEPNYFSDDAQYAQGEDWYESLFKDAKLGDLCGESSTHYTKLPDYPLAVERMAKRVKKPKLIYVMRHPIDRLISHYVHQWSQNVFKCDIDQAIEQYEELVAYSCYTEQLSPYFKQYGRENILPVFSEVLRGSPQQELERVANFIGYSGKVVWNDNILEQNVSSQRVRAFKGYNWLIDSSYMTFIRRTFIPQSLRDRVKKGLAMTERPTIGQANLAKLTERFDQDLARLGSLMSIELNCSNYKSVVKKPGLSWAESLNSKQNDLNN